MSDITQCANPIIQGMQNELDEIVSRFRNDIHKLEEKYQNPGLVHVLIPEELMRSSHNNRGYITIGMGWARPVEFTTIPNIETLLRLGSDSK